MKKFIALSLSCLCLCILSACGQTQLTTQDIASVTFEGYDGFGTATVNFNPNITETINPEKVADYVNKVSNVETLFSTEMIQEQGVSALLDYKIDETDNLSNGDKITLTISPSAEMEMVGQSMEDIEKGCGFQLESNTAEIEVTGLNEIKNIDLSQTLMTAIEFEGAEGSAEINFNTKDLSVTENGITLKGIEYSSTGFECMPEGTDNKTQVQITFEPNENLSSGDTVTATLHYETNATLEDGYTLVDSFEITVPELPEYITNADQITDQMRKDAIEYLFNGIKTNPQNDYYITFDLVKAYWGDLKPNAPQAEPGKEHYLQIEYEFEYQLLSTHTNTNSAFCRIMMYPDGTYKFSDIEYGSPNQSYDWKELNWDVTSYKGE